MKITRRKVLTSAALAPLSVLDLTGSSSPSSVHFVTPESPDPQPLTASVENHQAVFCTPGFLVYGVTIVDYTL